LTLPSVQAVSAPVAIYRFTLFDLDQSRIAGQFIDFTNDDDVRAHAQHLLKTPDTKRVEVWSKGRLVFATVKRGRPRKSGARKARALNRRMT